MVENVLPVEVDVLVPDAVELLLPLVVELPFVEVVLSLVLTLCDRVVLDPETLPLALTELNVLVDVDERSVL